MDGERQYRGRLVRVETEGERLADARVVAVGLGAAARVRETPAGDGEPEVRGEPAVRFDLRNRPAGPPRRRVDRVRYLAEDLGQEREVEPEAEKRHSNTRVVPR
ncbi:MAG: hypothetical protein KBB14_11655 [Thermoanaerobaculia bacterium]|nr:hypothetical protein [Thermoanaerobaculia bacterium]